MVRLSRLSTLIAALGAAAALVPAGNAASRDNGAPALPTLYVQYAMNCTFQIVDDFGKPVTSIPPGTYQVEVSTPIMFKLVDTSQNGPGDFTGCKGWVQFQLTGPGVNLFTTLDSGCDAFYLLPATTFKASSTYTAQDLNQPSVAHLSFTTQASGTPVLPKSPYTPTSGKGQLSTDIVGSEADTALAGQLTATLSQRGKPTLTMKGKPVSVLPSGRYRLAVTDRDPKGSFTVQRLDGKRKTLTGVRFVGRHAVTVRLAPGRWAYSAGHGTAYSFLVTAPGAS